MSELLLGATTFAEGFAHAAGVDEARRIWGRLRRRGWQYDRHGEQLPRGRRRGNLGEVLDGRRERLWWPPTSRSGSLPPDTTCTPGPYRRRRACDPDAATTDVSTHIKQITGLATTFRKHQVQPLRRDRLGGFIHEYAQVT